MSQGYGPLRTVLFANKIDDETGVIVDVLGRTNITVYLQGTGTTSSGVITIEESCWIPGHESESNSWASVATVNASDASAGAQKVTRLTAGSYSQLRIRISTVIGGGGSITARLTAQ